MQSVVQQWLCGGPLAIFWSNLGRLRFGWKAFVGPTLAWVIQPLIGIYFKGNSDTVHIIYSGNAWFVPVRSTFFCLQNKFCIMYAQIDAN